MLKKGQGTFINVASIGGTIAGVGDAAYITSKHAVVGYTKQLTFNYAKDGILLLHFAQESSIRQWSNMQLNKTVLKLFDK